MFSFGFKWELERVDEAEDGTLTVRAEVTNTGNHEGKEVLQLYGSAPAGVIDKPAKILIAYAKTKLLQPGENQPVRKWIVIHPTVCGRKDIMTG